MFSFKDQRVLILAPHPDDEVLGCGGLIHRCKQEGGKVYVLFLTVGETRDFSAKGVSTASERIAEIEEVAAFLGYDGYRIAFPGNAYHLKLDALPQKTLIDAIERGPEISLQALEPTIVALPLPHDYNQDHRAACFAMMTATRPSPPKYRSLQRLVLQYELPSNTWTDQSAIAVPNCFVELSQEDLDAKLQAFQCYKSQLKDPDVPLSVSGMATLAQMRGFNAGCRYAEGFVAKRVLISLP